MEDAVPKANFDWSVFNRWCDDYADRHSGMKPKVEDVRKWHRENAEKVWPDNSERPSVFLAVSHNKGRRVRGHKTCEYYKRYRAGKAAEQQLAARLQPAALSGRRILAVTAAARKVNTDCTRAVVKRSSPDILADSELGQQDADGHALGHAEKRRRMRAFGDDTARAGAGGRGSSSDGLSDDPSWASGAGTSNEDGDEDGDSGPGAVPSSRRCTAHPYQHPHVTAIRGNGHGPHAGVHITVVRRDADGRTIQVETQPARGGPHEHGARQALYPYYLGHHMSAAAAGVAVLPEGAVDQPPWMAASSHEHGDRDPDRRGKAGGGREPGSGADSEEACPELDATEQQHSGGAAAEQEGVWTGDHPGVAPRACRRARSCAEAEQRHPLRFSGYVPTPVGSMPVYHVGGVDGAGGPGGDSARARRVRRPPGDVGGNGAGGATALALRDPLDLLAEAACDALESPRPAGREGDGESVEPGRLAATAPADASMAGEAVAASDADASGGVKDDAAAGSSDNHQRLGSLAVERTHVEVDGADEGAASPGAGSASPCPVASACEVAGQGSQQQEPAVEAPAAGTVVKLEPCAGGTEAHDAMCTAASEGDVRRVMEAGELAGSRAVKATAAARTASGPGAKVEQQEQPMSAKLPLLPSVLDSLVPPLRPVPLFRQAQRSPPRLPTATANDDADGAAAKAACDGSGPDVAAATTAPPAAAASAAAAAPALAGAGDLSSCRLPRLNPTELEASLLSALGQQSRLPPLNAPVGLGLAPVGLPAVGLVPALPPPLPISALAAATPPASMPPPPLLWPTLTGAMEPMLAGAPALTAAAPLFADASVLGGALAGAGGGGGGQLLPMMRLLQMQMATRGLDSNACHD